MMAILYSVVVLVKCMQDWHSFVLYFSFYFTAHFKMGSVKWQTYQMNSIMIIAIELNLVQRKWLFHFFSSFILLCVSIFTAARMMQENRIKLANIFYICVYIYIYYIFISDQFIFYLPCTVHIYYDPHHRFVKQSAS